MKKIGDGLLFLFVYVTIPYLDFNFEIKKDKIKLLFVIIISYCI